MKNLHYSFTFTTSIFDVLKITSCNLSDVCWKPQVNEGKIDCKTNLCIYQLKKWRNGDVQQREIGWERLILAGVNLQK